MLRNILIVLTFFTLTACSDNDTAASNNATEKSAHAEEKGHNDKEHHGSGKETEHDDHGDKEHHDDDKEEHAEGGHEAHGETEEGGHEAHGEAEEGGHAAHGEEEGGHEEEAGSVDLKPEQMKLADIVVSALELTDVAIKVRAPGEIKLNAYRTIKVAPRINAQIIKRHAVLGDVVVEGQVLVTLSSVAVAEAQGQLLLADKEWKRVTKLGRKVVSARRYATAKIEYQKAFANAKAFGMSNIEIEALLKQKRSADGSFNLVATQGGRILHDKFIVGEYVEAGYELMVITDESAMWVEARVTPQITNMVTIGSNADIVLGDKKFSGKVIQLHHSLDETTRTSAVRIEVSNKGDHLHAGMFVTAFIETTNTNKALQVPEESVLRSSDGDWQIMVEQDEAGEFKGVEVELKNVSNGIAVIESKGENKIGPGTRVVTHGAFFVQSELAKGGFEIHNH